MVPSYARQVSASHADLLVRHPRAADHHRSLIRSSRLTSGADPPRSGVGDLDLTRRSGPLLEPLGASDIRCGRSDCACAGARARARRTGRQKRRRGDATALAREPRDDGPVLAEEICPDDLMETRVLDRIGDLASIGRPARTVARVSRLRFRRGLERGDSPQAHLILACCAAMEADHPRRDIAAGVTSAAPRSRA